MSQFAKNAIAVLFILVLGAGCGEELSHTDGGTTYGTTTAYFAPDADQPARSLLPLPNILATNLEVFPPTLSVLQSQCVEPGSVSEQLLVRIDQSLNGFATFGKGSIMAFFGSEVDLDSFGGKVFLYDLGSVEPGGAGPDLQNPITVSLVQTSTPKFIQGCSAEPAMVPTVLLIPVDSAGLPVPLEPAHLYGVVMLAGIKDAEGYDVLPSYAWTLIRSPEANPDLQVRLL
ncbi:MAG: hypothetical protein D6806_04090, partial [Deltaproteobacteria bacterium]